MAIIKECSSEGEIICPQCGTKYENIHDFLVRGSTSGYFECGGCERTIHWDAEYTVVFFNTISDEEDSNSPFARQA